MLSVLFRFPLTSITIKKSIKNIIYSLINKKALLMSAFYVTRKKALNGNFVFFIAPNCIFTPS